MKTTLITIGYYGFQLWLILICLINLQGCAATGTKNVDLFGYVKWENFAGTDYTVGYNNIDIVDNRRGVNNTNTPKKVDAHF